MTQDIIDAALALTETLAEENRALAAMDLPKAVALLARKHRAADAFAAAQMRLPSPLRAGQQQQVAQLAARLREQASANKRLLEHAIAVQSRVIGLLTRGVPRALNRAPRYDAAGAVRAQPTPAITLSARV